jgi:hypothetical protein
MTFVRGPAGWPEQVSVTGSAETFRELTQQVAGLDDASLEEEFRALELEARRLEARRAALVAEVDRRRLWAADGHRGMRGWCKAIAVWSNGECISHGRVAALTAADRGVGDALLAGDLGCFQVAEMARVHANPRVADAFAGAVGEFVSWAGRVDAEEFRIMLARWVAVTDPEGACRSAAACHAARRVDAGVSDGRFQWEALGAALDGATILAVFERFCAAELAADWDEARERHGADAGPERLARSHAQRRFDAFVAMCEAAATAAPGAARPEPLVNVMVDQETFTSTLAEMGLLPERHGELTHLSVIDRFCETSTGVVLDPFTAVGLALHGHVRRVVYGSDGHVIDLGRRQRLFRGAAMQAVLLQARHCIWPGCGVPKTRCEIDHLRAWADDGPTAPVNGGPLCSHHNRFKHRRYRIQRDPSGVWHTFRPDGSRIG